MSATSLSLGLNRVSLEAPWEWLAAGWSDLWRAWPFSLFLGVTFTGFGALITYGLWRAGLSAWIPVAAGGFALVGPVLAVGLYEISRRLEAGEKITLGSVLFVKTASPGQIAFIAALLLFAYLVWSRIALLLFALFFSGDYVPLDDFAAYLISNPDGLQLLIIGTLAGAIIAFAIFMITALSMPLLMHRKTDVFTAIATSISAVRRQPGVMLLWAWIVAVTIAVGFVTIVGVVVAFPLLGHATWASYRAMIPRDAL